MTATYAMDSYGMRTYGTTVQRYRQTRRDMLARWSNPYTLSAATVLGVTRDRAKVHALYMSADGTYEDQTGAELLTWNEEDETVLTLRIEDSCEHDDSFYSDQVENWPVSERRKHYSQAGASRAVADELARESFRRDEECAAEGERSFVVTAYLTFRGWTFEETMGATAAPDEDITDAAIDVAFLGYDLFGELRRQLTLEIHEAYAYEATN